MIPFWVFWTAFIRFKAFRTPHFLETPSAMSTSTVTMQPDTRIALVTGADRGCGLEFCKQLAGLGFLVVGTAKDAVNAQELNELAKESQNKVFVQQMDQTKEDEIKNLAEALRARNYRLE
jgi:(+)-neomenthol dehydrogenase